MIHLSLKCKLENNDRFRIGIEVSIASKSWTYGPKCSMEFSFPLKHVTSIFRTSWPTKMSDVTKQKFQNEI